MVWPERFTPLAQAVRANGAAAGPAAVALVAAVAPAGGTWVAAAAPVTAAGEVGAVAVPGAALGVEPLQAASTMANKETNRTSRRADMATILLALREIQ